MGIPAGFADGFADLLVDEISENLEEVSEEFIVQYNEFISNKNATFSGVDKKSIIQCMSTGKTNKMPWNHVTIRVDVSTLRDISKPRLTEFSVPGFVEELQCIGKEHNSGFGFNEYGRNHLKQIEIPNSVYALSNEVFKFFGKLEKLRFSEGSRLTIVGDEAFAYCESLKEIDMSQCERLTVIGKDVFMETSLKTLKISSRLRNFDNDTFRGCKIDKIYIDDRKMLFSDFIDTLRNNEYQAFWM